MMHDLSQAYTSINPAAINPFTAGFGLSAISPIAGTAQWGQPGYPGVAMHSHIHPQHLQSIAQAAQLLGAQNPLQAALYQQQLLALQNPYLQQQILYGQQNPFLQQQNPYGQQNPHLQQQNAYGQQNPFLQQQNPYGQQNPFLQQQNPYGQQNPFVNPILAQQYGSLLGPQIGGQPYMQYPQQLGSPYGQVNPVLAPQSWVGQAGQLGGGQINPLVQQLLARQVNTPGFAPWVGI
jgi:hypothetical protein